MPVRQQVHIDRALTEISVAYQQEKSNFIADSIFPVIPVMKQTDTYFVYNRDDFYRDEAQERALGTESVGSDYDVTVADPYFCRVYGFHKDVTEGERENADDPLSPDQDATEYVSNKLMIKREFLWVSKFFKTGVWGMDLVGADVTDLAANKIMKWSNPLSNPIKDIRALRTKMHETTGYSPNTLVISQRIYDVIAEHEDLIDRIKYTQKGFTTLDLIAQAFDMERVFIARAVANVAAKGEKGVTQFIFGDDMLLCYVAKKPGLRTASAGYTFAWKGLKGAGALGNRVIRIPMPWLGIGTERIEAEQAFDQKQICKDLGIFVSDVI